MSPFGTRHGKSNSTVRDLRAAGRKRVRSLYLEPLEDRVLLDAGFNKLLTGQLYRDLLHREADSTGLAFWSSLLNESASKMAVVRGIEGSAEFRTQLVDGLYDSLLLRPADAGGRNFLLDFLQSGGAVDDAKSILIASPEYYQKRADQNNFEFLTASYQDVLHRPIDPNGSATWLALLQANDAARSMVTALVVKSTEAHQYLVQGFFQEFLHRPAEAQAQNFYVDQLGHNLPQELVVAEIAGSEEYARRVQSPTDTQAPTITVQPFTFGQFTSANATLTGAATDDLSGVASLEAKVDSGTFSPVAFDATGHFSFTTTLVLDGSTDGSHTIAVRATDSAGNVATPAADSFTLDTTPPQVSIVTPAPIATVSQNVTVTGQVTDALIGVTSLSARVDGGASFTVPFSVSGQFNFATTLAVDGTADGSHTITLVATDALGNIAKPTTRSFTLHSMPLHLRIDTPAPDTTVNQNVTVSGQVTDDLAGVPSLSAQLDGGLSFSVPLDASGRFSFATTLALDGSAEGLHTVDLRATDNLGSLATHAAVSFTLDTETARLVVDSPAHDAFVNQNITISGHAINALAGVASLTAEIDGGPSFVVPVEDSGAFSLVTSLPLDGSADATHTVTFHAVDKAGSPLLSDPFRFTLDSQAPNVSILAPNPDTVVTTNISVVGVAGDSFLGLAKLEASVDGAAPIQVAVDDSGFFTVDTTFPLDGSADGDHQVTLVATDFAQNVSEPTSIHFVLHTRGQVPLSFDLDPASDTGVQGDQATTAIVVTLSGQTNPGAKLTLSPAGAQATADANGFFQFAGVSLPQASNDITVVSLDARGDRDTLSRRFFKVVPTDSAQVVVDWNQATVQAITLDASQPPLASRNLAMVMGALYDAVNAVYHADPSFFVSLAAPQASPIAAAAAAAHDVLVNLYPGQRASFDTLLAASLATVANGAAKNLGIAAGQSVASAVLALRANDGAHDYVDYTPTQQDGRWQPTAPLYLPALLPNWATLAPFALTSPSQFRPAGPPVLGSKAYADAVNQVKDLGRSDSTLRSADQTQIAKFWADPAGTATPPGHWNQIATSLVASQSLSLAQAAKLLAELNVAMGDAGIAAWDAKYTFDAWRPIQVIQDTSGFGNPGIIPDANWTPLLVTPNFPEYVSGHSMFSGAADEVLTAFFGQNFAFSAQSPSLAGVTRSFSSFDQAADEAGISRIYGGIHFIFSDMDGLATGRSVGSFVLQRFNSTTDEQSPAITIAGPTTNLAISKNITITGRTTDNLTGVKALTVTVDGGVKVAVAFDADGNFILPTTFALNGGADGKHMFHFEAADNAGNVTSGFDLVLTLDTKAPRLTISAPGANDILGQSAVLSGLADGTGTPLTQLGYALDGGVIHPIAFGLDGAFDQALGLGSLEMGQHHLTVSTLDQAGNAASTTIAFQIAAPPPLNIASQLPEDGAVDVGVTYRPKVVFSRPIETSSLDTDNFYLTFGGKKLPATVVPSDDGTFAWLFPTTPLPSAAIITINVDGGSIRTADGTRLDGAGTGMPGSVFHSTFSTVSYSSVTGASFSGILADPGADFNPGTIDDVRGGADGVLMTRDDLYLHPIVGATLYILGQENLKITTGADGSFTFPSVPVGDVKLVVDGRTATNAPAGFYFPEMVMDLHTVAGQATTVMDAMRTDETRAVTGIRGVYLPRLLTSILHQVNTATNTHVTVDAAAAPQLTDEQRSNLSLDVSPDSLIGPDGQKMLTGQIGVSTVPPSLVMDMLPPGLLEHTFDITIQAPGVTTFSTPVAMTFPNVFDAAPGTQLSFLSFDHTTGRLVIEGTATVSPDGKSVHTDPGSGVIHPGWHGLAPAGSPSDKPCPMPPPSTVMVKPNFVDAGTLVDRFFTTDKNFFVLAFGNDVPRIDATKDPCDPVNTVATPLVLQISIDGPASDFLVGLPENPKPIVLFPGQQNSILVNLKELIPGIINATADELFGITINVVAKYGDPKFPDQLKDLSEKRIYVYRYLNASDPAAMNEKVLDKSVLTFPSTLNDNSGGVSRPRPVEFHMGVSTLPTFQFANPQNFYFDDPKSAFVFDPVINLKGVMLSTKVQLITPDNQPVGDPLTLQGEGTPKFKIYVNRVGLANTLRAIAEMAPNPFSPAKISEIDYYRIGASKRAMIGSDAERDAIVDQVVADISKNFASFSDAISVTDDPAAANAVKIIWTTTPGDFRDKGFSQPAPTDDGVDNLAAIKQLMNDWQTFNKPIQNFVTAAALNQSFSTNIQVFVESHLEDPISMPFLPTPAQLASALAKAASHEAGHTLGANHTARSGELVNVKQEQQKIVLSNVTPTSKFTLTFDGQTTAELDPAISDSDLANELAKLTNIGLGNVAVLAGPANTFTVTFQTRLQGVNVPELTATGTNGLIVQVNTLQDGHAELVPKVVNNVTAEVDVGSSSGINDIMAGGFTDPAGALSFLPGLSLEVLKLGLKMDWTPEDAQRALSFMTTQFSINVGESPFDGDDDFVSSDPITGRHLAVFDAENQLAATDLAFGTVGVDGSGNASQSRTLHLVNFGNEDVTIQSAEILDPDGNFSAAALSGFVLKPGDSVPFVINYDPLTSGDQKATLHIVSNDPSLTHDFHLTGFGLSPKGDIRLTVPNSNVGGVKLSDPLRFEHAFATIHNIGDRPLSISSVTIAGDSDQFGLFNLPPGMSAAHPFVLDPGKTLDFDMTFDAKYLGLQRAEIQIFSDDPETPMLSQGVLGTGLADKGSALDYGNDYVALETPLLPAAPVFRQRSDDMGNWSFFLPPQTSIHYVIFDPVSGLVADFYATSAQSGQNTEILAPNFYASTAPDSDGDGLPDDIEFAIGTSPRKVDTDGDGLSDFVQIQEGLDPLGGRAFPTGVIANVAIQGEAQKVTFAASGADVQKVTGFVAAGSGGLAVLDVSNFAKPMVESQLPLPGIAVDIDVDASTQIAAVAASSGGLHLVDISDPQNPRLERTIPVLTKLVSTYAGVAYVSSSTALQSYDLQSGSKVGTLDLKGDTIRTMARENNFLYVVDDFSVLRVVELRGLQMIARGSLQLPSSCSDLVVGNGVAYASATSNARGGFETIDVSNPDQPVLISDTDVAPPAAFPRTALALTGSGKAVLVGSINGGVPAAPASLTLVDSSNPQVTNAFLTQIDLAGDPFHVALASGIAYISEGIAGIQVANFLPFDTLGVAPLVSVVPQVADGDPNAPGVQVLEGTYFPVQAQVQDDVQVRDVQLLIDGEVVTSAVSFPFNLAALAPRIQGQKTSFTLQIRATDTGGNTTLTTPMTIGLLPDVTPPTIVKTDPAEGDKKPRGFRSLQVTFSEAVAAEDVNDANFQVFDANNNLVPAESVTLRGDDTVVQVNFADLNSGDYRLVIHKEGVHDRAGNPVGVGDATTHFSIDLYSIRFQFNKNSDFLDPANWDLGRVPGPADYVLIDVPGNVVVQLEQFGAFTHTNAAVTVAGMTVNTPLSLELGGDLTVLETLELNSTLGFNDGILQRANILAGPNSRISSVPLTGSSPFIDDFGNVATLDGVSVVGDLRTEDNGTADLTIINGLTVNGSLTGVSLDINREDTFVTGTVAFRDGRIDVTKGRSLVLRENVLVQGQTQINIAEGATLINKGRITSDRDAGYARILFLDNKEGATTIGHLKNDGVLEAINGGILAIQDSVGVGPNQVSIRLLNDNLIHVGNRSILLLDNLDLTSAKMVADTGSTVLFASRLRSTGRKPSILSGNGNWLANGQPDGTTDFTRVGIASTLFAGGTVNLTDGAVLKGSLFLQDVTLNGDIELTDDYSIPAYFQGLFRPNTHDIVILGSVQINGQVMLGGIRDTFEAHLLGAGHNAILGGTASILFSTTPGNAVVTAQSFSEFILGSSVTVVGSNLHIGTLTGNNNSFTNHGTFDLADGTVLVDGIWSNPDGHIKVSGSDVTLGGAFAPRDLAGFVRSGGTVDLTGNVFCNGATLQLDASTGSWTFSGGFILDGTLVTLDGTSLIGTTKAGHLTNVTIDGLVDLPAGLGLAIHASGLVLGQGTLRIGSGTEVNSIDTYTQNSTGELALTIGGSPNSNLFGKLTVSGNATLDGTLDLTLTPGFDPNLGDVYTIVAAGSITGTFATINGVKLSGGKQFQVVYSGQNVTLVVVAG